VAFHAEEPSNAQSLVAVGREGQGKPSPEPSNIYIMDDARLVKIILARSENELTIIDHFMQEIYSTAPRIKEVTSICEATVYRSLKKLRERGIIHIVGKIKPPDTKGGPAINIWKITGVNKKWE